MKGWHVCETHNITYTCPKCRNDPERQAMVLVCEAAKARMETYDRGEDYTGGIKSVEWKNLRTALAELERARKGEG